MNGVRTVINRLLCRMSRRYKFYAICRALGIKPTPWQRAYAMGQVPPWVWMDDSKHRCTGKTTAVMLRTMMRPAKDDVSDDRLFRFDPDFSYDLHRRHWYRGEYSRMYRHAVEAGIEVPCYSNGVKGGEERRMWQSLEERRNK